MDDETDFAPRPLYGGMTNGSRSSFFDMDPEVPCDEDDEWERVIAVAGSRSLPEGDAVYGDEELFEPLGWVELIASLSFGGVL